MRLLQPFACEEEGEKGLRRIFGVAACESGPAGIRVRWAPIATAKAIQGIPPLHVLRGSKNQAPGSGLESGLPIRRRGGQGVRVAARVHTRTKAEPCGNV